MAGFAVIDFETTGFSNHDRIVEIALIQLDRAGRVETEWSTLLNPERDLGPTHVHRIQARDVVNAPRFPEIAGTFLNLLQDRAVVAHNAAFENRFLQNELARCSVDIPLVPSLCTMRWSGRAWRAPAKLADLCEFLGFDLYDAHTALGDTRATARVAQVLNAELNNDLGWQEAVRTGEAFSWPAIQSLPVRLAQRSENPVLPTDWLSVTADSVSLSTESLDDAAYLLELEKAMLDRNVSVHEGKLLAHIAGALGMTMEHRLSLHRQYLSSLACAAWADGHLSEEEMSDLLRAAEVLGLSETAISSVISEAQHMAATASLNTVGSSSRLLPGDRIVFTGALTTPREAWVKEVTAAGLTTGAVTKRTRMLVAADPDSLSGKAKKARDYGVPIVDEATFSRVFADYLKSQ